MSDVRQDSESETEIVPRAGSGPEGAPEETGSVEDKPGFHIHLNGNQRLISITELTARTIVSVLDTVQGRGSAAKIQLGMAQKELEEELARLEPAPPPVPLNRAQRRRAEHS